MRERYPGIGGAAGGCRHAGYHLKRDAVGREGVDLLAAAPEDERIAALQAQDAFAFPRQFHQQLVDLLLAKGMA